MITYRKKSLKVHNIFGYRSQGAEKHPHAVARQLRDFIEEGEYSRIVDMFFYGESNHSLVCSIIYEQALQEKTDGDKG